ncbi:PSD1 and planctomycete cytochrome C domain-containing protein [Lunatibacter salilacus]|uniref:PSD1 and planctomycete cytochrome C domain-containing protein n=1 Tax=Lunatibacter salilacus TaxID=2483804 RepID=UPI00131C46B8|nr:PSD1 and planctomycete cytochrome C domain-containing protein [Lunatibacter salilacus]
MITRNFLRYFIVSSILGSIVFGCGEQSVNRGDLPLPDEVSYNLHIRPILSENCFACHGPDANKREAGLRLDIPEDAFKVLEESPGLFALVPKNPLESHAYLRLVASDESEQMPPPSSNLKVGDREIALIEKWIKQGATYQPHWAFTSPEKIDLPRIKAKKWPQNPIDHYILAAQEERGLSPNTPADREQLLRRVTFDLTGLPPTLEEMERFISDQAEDAYERVVDSLFASRAYGEKMAVHWMDISRYADSHGYQDDYYRTQWPWRDWVIHAFNQNMPYDQFVTWQLAGDLLPNPSKEQILATGFNRNHKITEESGAIDEEYRVSYVVDRTNTIGKALIGMTLECAQCHDHKYDPISQKEYFQVYAFFNNVAEVGMEESSPGFSRKSPAKHPMMEITDEDVDGILSFLNRPDSAALSTALIGDVNSGANYQALLSETGKLRVSVMADLDTIRPSFVLLRGDYETYGEEVFPGTPERILPFDNAYPKNRLGLSQWLFDTGNPLTARVFVNRIWQQIFGAGLVSTPGDFGMQGALPTHPELLDWLAVEFMENGWDIKRLLRQIVLSNTYRQSSNVNPDHLKKDPENIYLARFPRNRLPAEHIRDLVLSSSGLLVPTIGGPSVKPYQPPGLWELATSGRGNLASYKQDSLGALYRRGLYTFIKRTVPPPSMILFDASNRDECEIERERTNTPLQALMMMNDPTVLEASRVLAATLMKETGTREDVVREGFRRIVGRNADQIEISILAEFLEEMLLDFESNPDVAIQLLQVGDSPIPTDLPISELAAMMQVIHTIYNMEESITKS